MTSINSRPGLVACLGYFNLGDELMMAAARTMCAFIAVVYYADADLTWKRKEIGESAYQYLKFYDERGAALDEIGIVHYYQYHDYQRAGMKGRSAAYCLN
ncbi:MAG TPA: hypothetical protein PKZ07_14590 [Sedimentisphaerales bacterium]|nr:hypothetical protein [Sedimentisphaerales bacterium]